ncbi:helix-turn-helix domain-containing protein [Streptomyces sp. A1499]|uniref:winged helix-turn-helix domain-containing protein n=1 Tax=Streptomyces sp. A1499 TaxID=2563104 RepID=UPI0007C67934|nr:helix-turn-helix domain-containing protein [Streptomyces sp. A1499]THC48737.1 ArsR family transcriptional regulator [Streptomyces sp. A1499]
MSFKSRANPVARPGRVPITDVRVLGAFAHPLRLRLLHHLMRKGPDTASRCAEAVDDSASNCSYHLRLLHRYGLVERVEAEDGSDARDRPWRAVSTGFDFLPDGQGPESLAAHSAVVGAELGELTRLVRHFLANFGSLEEPWQRAAVFDSYALALTPDELLHLTSVIDLLVRPYIIADRRDVPPDAAEISFSVQAFRRPKEQS